MGFPIPQYGAGGEINVYPKQEKGGDLFDYRPFFVLHAWIILR
jgi:hypothetical protein